MDIFYSLKEMVPKPEVQPISQDKEIKASLYQKNDKIYKLTFTLFGHLLLLLASLIEKKDHLIKWLVGDMKPVDKAVNSVASAALATTIRNPVQVSERNMPPSAKDHLLQHVRQALPQKSGNTESYNHIIDKCHEFMFTEPLDFAYVASLIHDIGEYEALYGQNPLKHLED